MMPSLDHCISNSSEMTTLTNTLEVFDTYKHRDDKDSDEESFHLPLDDDESDSKVQDSVRNGNGNETEDDILNKFEGASGALDHIDSQLEERLLNEEEEEKKEAKQETANTSTKKLESDSTQIVENGIHSHEEGKDEDVRESEANCTASKDVADLQPETDKQSSPSTNLLEKSTENVSTTEEKQESQSGGILNETNAEKGAATDINEDSKSDATENNNVPKVDVGEELSSTNKDASAIDALKNTNEHLSVTKVINAAKEDKLNEKSAKDNNDSLQPIVDEPSGVSKEQKDNKDMQSKSQGDVNEDASNENKSADKGDDLNESCKHNEDSEDLFDISIIRDAEEDNAESAYNEAHAEENQIEENEEYDDRADDKMEDDCVNDKGSNEEDDEMEEMDIDKHEDHLKSDDVDIEEGNLKLDCDATKDSVSDGEGENCKKTDVVQISNEQKASEKTNSVEKRASECRLDEVTGSLIGVDGREINYEDDVTEEHNDNEDPLRNSLKRPSAEDGEAGAAKKLRTEQTVAVEAKEKEKPKEKLPLRTLLSLSDFMKTRKHNRRLTMQDLEEFCVQKICEAIVHKSELGDVHHQLKLQEQLIETMRKEIQQLTKQARDLEIVNKKLMNDLKQQTATQKPLNPLKITRSVGLQVKFTPTFEANLKRRQPNPTVSNQKVQAQTPPARSPRVTPNVVTTVNRQVASPQKQQQVQSKPTTPLLSQALQNRRSLPTDNTNKIPNQTVRIKPADPKSGTPSASVIDLTDEDDKKDKNKATPAKIVPSKNITVPLRTTPMRVNATAQGLRLTTSQGKVSPITSVVTSSTPQVMYVVQSSPQNVLTSPLGPKAVVVNFQSANGVLTSTLNGSAVSVIPKQGNTIQLKTVAPTKTLQSNKIVKVSNKHPAPLPPPPVVRINLEKPLKPIPPKPHLTIRKTDTGIILQWKMPYELDMYEVIASYQLYAYQETSALPSTDMWRKVGDVKALALPMACTLTQFADKNKYYFAVRPVDIHKRIGMFSEPEEISL